MKPLVHSCSILESRRRRHTARDANRGRGSLGVFTWMQRSAAASALGLLLSCAGAQAPGPAVAPGTERTSDLASTVVLISLDGFRWDQLDFPEATHLRELANEGVRAEGLIPVFPSKTFPNHYSIVTGLYAGNHGIVSNNMRDAKLGEFHLSDREAVQNSGWWGGEPLWVTAHRAGLITAAMFWPGTEAPVGGVQPDFWRPFDSEFPFEQRVEQVLEWLALPSGERPRFITLYFQEPDGSNHRFGPLSEEAHHAIARVDAQIGALRDGIATLGADQRVDLIVVSDHGMADVHSDRMIVIDELVDFEPGELFETGALVQVFPKPGRETLLFEALRNADPHLKVYRREELPASFHLGGSDRIAPLVGVPDVGWEAVTALRRTAQRAGPLGGHHGPDPADQRMHGLFVAGGPSIASGVTLPRFENVHIYEFVCSLLGIEPAPNDGDPAVLRSLVRRSPPTLR